jgi:phospholipase/carboxylesterase
LSDAAPPEIPEAYARALTELGGATLFTLVTLEAALRRLHPPLLPDLREKVEAARARLEAAVEAFGAQTPPPGIEAFHEQLAAGSGTALDAARRFVAPAPPEQLAAGVLGAMRVHARSQELLYPLRQALPPLAAYFTEPALHDRLEALEPAREDDVAVGLLRADGNAPDGRGGFCLYVPETCTRERPLPLVVALHGGHGHGRDFVWSWLREARSRRCLLLSPTSRGDTWALHDPHGETRALASMVEYVGERWRVDPERILLTGLSDGATFTLLAGLSADVPFTHLAPVSGVLHPDSESMGNLARAAGKPVYLVHGALDWMFPVALARMAGETLRDAGAALVYREIEDLSHAYPREENARILEWLDPGLALPAPPAG